ncbi:N-acetylglucosamine-6-phosphate deacetylase [Armadillidium nasatum]|uniref:N-acetylglucosamine-6-phosphate deacetylase n=1 Tax=Armadillidium nasatum TaxID=96803 RepID=A0A5N5TAX0_9CRUS|nr:N-acetylglucosamine-6-phosphate deacetylase [Armadillidium nasatum]
MNKNILNNEITKFENCRIIRNGNIVKDDLWVRNGVIINPEPVFYEERVSADVVVDCQESLIAPGFIDVQINGGFGYDFSSDNHIIVEALNAVRKGILRSGVTSFCPTIVTSPKEVYYEVIPQIKRDQGGASGAEILGIHLEGPFISPNKKGAHPVDFIKGLENGIETVLDTYGSLTDVAILTLAPELPKAGEVIRKLVEHGHSNGNLLHGEKAVSNGASFITHLFNAMLPFHHRDPGLVGLLTSQYIPQPIYYGIIADGIHTHPAALRIAHRTLSKGLVLVTDAMAALGLGDGLHQIGQLVVEVKGREAFLKGTDTLAGSIAPMNECIRRFMKAAEVGIVEGVEAASLHPARLLGIADKKGSLNFGADADFVLLNGSIPEEVEVLHTFIGGRCVYSDPSAKSIVCQFCC